jgi:hypothetical protein
VLPWDPDSVDDRIVERLGRYCADLTTTEFNNETA